MQAIGQVAGRVGFEQVAVQRRFGGFGDLGVGGIEGDHEKDGGVGQQLVAAQIVQQILAGTGVLAEVLLAQDDVKSLVFELAARIGYPRALHNRSDAKIAQLIDQNGSGGRIAVNDQGLRCAEVVFK
jgi:hypothetical protein